MKRNVIHSIAVFLTACTLPFMAACCGREESLQEAAETALYMNVGTIGNTKSALSELYDNERMTTLRVIILHEDGTVEHNRFFSLAVPQTFRYILLKVTPDENKKIFLFANEESVDLVEGVGGDNMTLSAFFDSYAEGASGFAEDVDGLYFAPDYSNGRPIPMSSMYEIAVPEKGNVTETFYLVRVATRFRINFMNWRNDKVVVNGFSIANHADKNFLMAHVNDSERNRLLFKGKTWIEWLKEVSEASSENDSYEVTEAAGWLKDYELPAQANMSKTYTYGRVTVGLPAADPGHPDGQKPGVADVAPVFYLPESSSLKTGATDGEQEYTLSISVEDRDEPFVFTMPNLKALFRNTDVLVNISMYNGPEIRFKLTVEPWKTGGRTEIEM